VTRLTPEQQALAAAPESIALARGIARRMARRCPHEYESIEAAALFGLVLAAAAFDPAAGIKFASFAQHRIRGEVLDAARVLMPRGFRRGDLVAARGEQVPRLASLYRPIYEQGPERSPVRLGDTLDSGEEPVGAGAEYLDLVESLARRLPSDYRAAFRAYHTRAGVTMKQLARELGYSESRVSQVVSAVSPPLLRESLAARGI
jgi:RNA polymerase sigma factor (sigma-70 family)